MPDENASIIRPANPGEAAILSDLALRSKAHWGYSQDFVESCRNELTYYQEQIRDGQSDFFVLDQTGKIVGFYVLEFSTSDICELEGLFVEPESIGMGYGSRLLQHARIRAAARGAESMVVQSDPNALEFYRRAGATLVGTQASGSVEGRLLPMLRFQL